MRGGRALLCGALLALPTPVREAPDVWVSGCSAWSPVGTCVPGSGGLWLWLAVPPGVPIRVGFDGTPVDVAVMRVAGGTGVRLAVPSGAREVYAEVEGGHWQLPLFAWDVEPVLDQAYALRAAHDFPELRNWLAEGLDEVSARRRGEAQGLLARAYFQSNQRTEAERLLEAALASGATPEAEAAETAMLIKVRLAKGDLPGAVAAAAQCRVPPRDLDRRYALSFMMGDLQAARGDRITARRWYDAASADASRLDDVRARAEVDQRLATVLEQSGGAEAAVGILDETARALAGRLTRCDEVDLLTSRAWARLMMPGGDAGAAIRDLEDARTRLDDTCIRAGLKRANLDLNLAIAHLAQSDASGAAAALDRSGLAPGAPGFGEADPTYQLWGADTAARVVNARGDGPAAVRAWVGLGRLAARLGSLEFEARAALGSGDTLARIGRDVEAAEELARAQELFLTQSALVPRDIGTDAVLEGVTEALRGRVPLLVRFGHPDEALRAVREVRGAWLRGQYQGWRIASLAAPERSRWDAVLGEYAALRSQAAALDEREWTVPGTERAAWAARRSALAGRARLLLERWPPPSAAGPERARRWTLREPWPGELMLSWFEARDGWYGLAASRSGVRAVGPVSIDPGAADPVLSASLLTPFEQEIRGAGRLTLLPTGALRSRDLHALPFGAALLQHHLPVTYGVDLEALPRHRGLASALVVADPSGDLPSARRAGEQAASELASRVEVTALVGDTARRRALLAAWPGADLFFYLGHAATGLGRDAEPALLLAHDESITATDLLVLDPAPRIAVLFGCTTATAGEGSAEPLGVAQALLAAGTEMVIATTRPTSDSLAAALSAALLHEGFPSGDPSASYRAAMTLIMRRYPSSDWSNFRIYTR